MNEQHDLFGDSVPSAPLHRLQTLKIEPSKQANTPPQRRFNKLITRIENLTNHLQTIEDRLQRLHPPHQQRMHTLRQQTMQAEKALTRQLHQQLQVKGLSANQKKWVRGLVENLLLQYPPQSQPTDDAAWQALFDLYHPAEKLAVWEQEDRAEIETLRKDLEAMLGQPIEGLEQAESVEDVMAILMSQTRDSEPTEKLRNKKVSAKQQRLVQQQVDAQATLKQIYRQLASALHPDRETDDAARAHKTTLMSEANAAYERRDLSTLLRLQLQVVQVAPESLARMTDEKLSSMNQLLQEQVSTLEYELRQSEDRASYTLGFGLSATQPESIWLRELQQQHDEASQALARLESDLIYIQEIDQLKVWIKEQIEYEKAQIRAQKKWGKFLGDAEFGGFF